MTFRGVSPGFHLHLFDKRRLLCRHFSKSRSLGMRSYIGCVLRRDVFVAITFKISSINGSERTVN